MKNPYPEWGSPNEPEWAFRAVAMIDRLAGQLAEVQAQRDGLKDALVEIGSIHVESHEDAYNMRGIATEALAKLEVSDGK